MTENVRWYFSHGGGRNCEPGSGPFEIRNPGSQEGRSGLRWHSASGQGNAACWERAWPGLDQVAQLVRRHGIRASVPGFLVSLFRMRTARRAARTCTSDGIDTHGSRRSRWEPRSPKLLSDALLYRGRNSLRRGGLRPRYPLPALRCVSIAPSRHGARGNRGRRVGVVGPKSARSGSRSELSRP